MTNAGAPAYTALVVAAMLAYLAAFSPGMSPVPWAVNAEIYPLQVLQLASVLLATTVASRLPIKGRQDR